MANISDDIEMPSKSLEEDYCVDVDINTVVFLQPDEEADQSTLGPATQEQQQTDLLQDIQGTDALDLQQKQTLVNLIHDFSPIFTDTPDLPAYHLDTGQAPAICRKPYRPALQWKSKIEQEHQTVDFSLVWPDHGSTEED